MSIVTYNLTPAASPDHPTSLQDKICLSFGTGNVIEQDGAKAALSIPIGIFDFVQIDTTVTIQGVTFTFVAVPDPDKNEVLYSNDSGDDADALAAAALGNYKINDELNIVSVLSFAITAKDCMTDIIVSFNNLDNDPDFQEYSALPTPLKARQGYCIKANIECDKACKQEIKITPKPVSECLGCFATIPEENFMVSINSLLVCQPCPFPEDGGWNVPLFDMVTPIDINYGESYDGNIFGLCEIPTLDVTPIANASEAQLVTYYEDDQSVCRCQRNIAYFYLPKSDNITERRVNLEVFDSSGASIFDDEITLLNSGANVLEYDIGIPNLLDQFIDLGDINICDAASYTIKFIAVSNVPEIFLEQITLKIDECKCSMDVVFKTDQGVYQSVPVKCMSKRTLNITREFITSCKPCATAKEVVQTCCDTSIEVTTSLLGNQFYNEDQLEQLYSSKDVRILVDDTWVAILPLSNSVDIFDKDNRNIVRPFNFRIFEYK